MSAERYHPLVANDLRDACLHNDAIASFLGERFRMNVQLKIKAVIERPESFGFIGGGFRAAIVSRFPYVVLFTIEEGFFCIYGVRHAASDQATWFDRTMP